MTRQGPVLPRLKVSNAVAAPGFNTGRGKQDRDLNHKRRHTQNIKLPNTVRGDARTIHSRRPSRSIHPAGTCKPASRIADDPMTAAGD